MNNTTADDKIVGYPKKVEDYPIIKPQQGPEGALPVVGASPRINPTSDLGFQGLDSKLMSWRSNLHPWSDDTITLTLNICDQAIFCGATFTTTHKIPEKSSPAGQSKDRYHFPDTKAIIRQKNNWVASYSGCLKLVAGRTQTAGNFATAQHN